MLTNDRVQLARHIEDLPDMYRELSVAHREVASLDEELLAAILRAATAALDGDPQGLRAARAAEAQVRDAAQRLAARTSRLQVDLNATVLKTQTLATRIAEQTATNGNGRTTVTGGVR